MKIFFAELYDIRIVHSLCLLLLSDNSFNFNVSLGAGTYLKLFVTFNAPRLLKSHNAMQLVVGGSIEITIAFTLDKGSNTEHQQPNSIQTKANHQQMPTHTL